MAMIVSVELMLVPIWPTVGSDFEAVTNQRSPKPTAGDLSSKLKSGLARVSI